MLWVGYIKIGLVPDARLSTALLLLCWPKITESDKVRWAEAWQWEGGIIYPTSSRLLDGQPNLEDCETSNITKHLFECHRPNSI